MNETTGTDNLQRPQLQLTLNPDAIRAPTLRAVVLSSEIVDFLYEAMAKADLSKKPSNDVTRYKFVSPDIAAVTRRTHREQQNRPPSERRSVRRKNGRRESRLERFVALTVRRACRDPISTRPHDGLSCFPRRWGRFFARCPTNFVSPGRPHAPSSSRSGADSSKPRKDLDRHPASVVCPRWRR
jgi:hypothetical protein